MHFLDVRKTRLEFIDFSPVMAEYDLAPTIVFPLGDVRLHSVQLTRTASCSLEGLRVLERIDLDKLLELLGDELGIDAALPSPHQQSQHPMIERRDQTIPVLGANVAEMQQGMDILC